MKRIYLKTAYIFFISGFSAFVLNAQNPAYKLFRDDGKKVQYEKMLEAASEADVVLFGEFHTNPISHWLQLELTTDLYEKRGADLVLGAEMFEADNQLIMDEYLAGHITETKFEEEARLWKNYKTDYKPLVLLAREHELTFVATNIPRRYANMVFKKGVDALDNLSAEAKAYMAPLPLEYDRSLDCYRQLMGAGGGPMSGNPRGDTLNPIPHTMNPKGDTLNPMPHTMNPKEDTLNPMPDTLNPKLDTPRPMGGHGSINLADAQAIKDATMSYFILKHWQPGKLFIHYNGAYHSDEFESMNWFLKRANPELNILTISTVSQDEVEQLEEESEGKADFIIAVPSNMTQTHR